MARKSLIICWNTSVPIEGSLNKAALWLKDSQAQIRLHMYQGLERKRPDRGLIASLIASHPLLFSSHHPEAVVIVTALEYLKINYS